MIRNEKQYECTQELLKRCEYTLTQYDAQDEEVKKNDPWWSVMRESIQSHLNAFKAEIAEYGEHLIFVKHFFWLLPSSSFLLPLSCWLPTPISSLAAKVRCSLFSAL